MGGDSGGSIVVHAQRLTPTGARFQTVKRMIRANLEDQPACFIAHCLTYDRSRVLFGASIGGKVETYEVVILLLLGCNGLSLVSILSLQRRIEAYENTWRRHGDR